MRICSIITSFTSGGAETLVCNMSELFQAAGHASSVIALSDAAQVGNSSQTEHVMMTRVRASGSEALSLSVGSRGLIAGGLALRREIGRRRPDVIHAHTARAALMLSIAFPAAPVILTHHNSRLSFPPQLFKVFDRIVHSYVAISEECATQTRRLARRPVRLIINGAAAAYRSATGRAPPPMDPTILAVGTLSDQKDYPTLIRAVHPLLGQLAPHGISPRVRIVGGGAPLEHFRGLVAEEGLESVVELLGPRSDVPEIMRASDLFVNCSLYEGLSVAMIEAMMSGLPIVATDVPGNRELVIPGRNGLLVPPGNAEQLAESIAAILIKPDDYTSFSSGSLAASSHLTIEACADAHLALYHQASDRRALSDAA